jgi:hypothetical protein
MFTIIGKTIKGLFYLALLLVGYGIFAGMSHHSFSVPSIDIQTRCDHYNSSYSCETQMR